MINLLRAALTGSVALRLRLLLFSVEKRHLGTNLSASVVRFLFELCTGSTDFVITESLSSCMAHMCFSIAVLQFFASELKSRYRPFFHKLCIPLNTFLIFNKKKRVFRQNLKFFSIDGLSFQANCRSSYVTETNCPFSLFFKALGNCENFPNFPKRRIKFNLLTPFFT